MKTRTLIDPRSRSRWIAAAGVVLITALTVGYAFADFGTQLVPFFHPDGSQVVSANGEPDDAVLNRFFDTRKDRINWQFMIQYLNPGEEYEVWLEGTNNGADGFSWWVGSSKATAQGKLNAIGNVFVGKPLGQAYGSFENSRAETNLVIKTTNGAIMQTAHFPRF